MTLKNGHIAQTFVAETVETTRYFFRFILAHAVNDAAAATEVFTDDPSNLVESFGTLRFFHDAIYKIGTVSLGTKYYASHLQDRLDVVHNTR